MNSVQLNLKEEKLRTLPPTVIAWQNNVQVAG